MFIDATKAFDRVDFANYFVCYTIRIFTLLFNM